MELADPLRSYAVLIGSSTFADPGLDDLPAVANNLARLGELLEDPTVWGLPPDRCVRVPEPASPGEVLDAVHDAARRTEDTLLVYYAGHGLSDADGLLLTLPSTDPQRPYTSVGFDSVRREVLTARRDANRIVILDCCYSGGALVGGMSGGGAANAPVEMAEQTRIAGSYLLTASAATRKALAPPGETYTAFTGELIRLLDQGLPGGDSLIEVTSVYERLRGELLAKGRPLPQQRLSNTGRTLAIARNRYGAAHAAPPPSETLPGPKPAPPALTIPDDLKEALRGKPRALAREYVRWGQTEGGRAHARELLRLAGALRPPQEVAALVALLNGDSWGIPFQEVAARGPQAVVECLEALYAVDGAEEAPHGLIEVVTTQIPEIVVGTVRALRAAGYPAEADRLLSRTVAENAYTEYVLGLLGALWSAELDADADRVLAEATTESDEEAVRFADALLTMGRRQKAFELYVRAAAVVVRRSPGDLIRVLKALDEEREEEREEERTGGRPPEAADARIVLLQGFATTLLDTAVAEAETPAGLAELCEALWSAGMEGRALIALAAAAESYDAPAVVELADALRESGHADGVRHLMRAAAFTHPVETTPYFVEALRDMGWPVDANRLLATALTRSPEEIAALLASFGPGRERDRAQLVTAVNSRPVADRLRLLSGLLAAPGDYEDFLASVALLPDEDFLEVLEALRAADDPTALVTLFRFQIRADPMGAARRLLFLIDNAEAFGVERAVLAALAAKERDGDSELSVAEVSRLVGPTVALEARVYATAALWAAGYGEQVRTALSRQHYVATGTYLVRWLVALHDHSLPECVNAVIASRSLTESSPPILADLVAGLAEADMKDAATFALKRYAFALGPQQVSALARRLALMPALPAPSRR
ncbi:MULTISPECIES: caspase family protein [unclassified Streptomyces]|uniref:caspase, EACC1-associated type n=1 Tax=unclassified Streptomyces TaxID=2593676 RepID=UPI0036E86955